jgi:hypothetical protein
MTDRERFEEWAVNYSYPIVKQPDGNYRDSFTQRAWDTWQAAVAARDAERCVSPSYAGTNEDLLRNVMRGVKPVRGLVHWAAVMRVVGTGATVAKELCLWAGIDPDAVGKRIEIKEAP